MSNGTFTPVKATNLGEMAGIVKITAIHFNSSKTDRGPIWYGKVELGNAFMIDFKIMSTQKGDVFVVFPQSEFKGNDGKKRYKKLFQIIDTEYDNTIKQGILTKYNNGQPEDYVSKNSSNWNERNPPKNQQGGTNTPANNGAKKDEAFD